MNRIRTVGSSMYSSSSASMKHFRGGGGSSSLGSTSASASSASTSSMMMSGSVSASNASTMAAAADRTGLVDFMPVETMHQWKRMLECDEFVGARRSKHTAVSYNDAIYVFGGDNGKNMLNDLIRFDIKDKSWSRAFAAGTPPAARYHHSAVVHESSMFVFGGYTGDILSNSNLSNCNDLFEYRFQNGQWLERKFTGRAPVPRSAHGAAVFDNKLWIYAGYDGNARLNDMWTMQLNGDAATAEWHEVEQHGDRPPTCCNFPVAVSGDSMYVFSGQSGLQITNTLFEFHFKTQTWRRITNEHIVRVTPSPPARRYGHTMVAHDRCLYVFGGSADSTLPNDLHCYDLVAERWSVIIPEPESQVPTGRVFHASAVIGDAMYTFGGTVDNNVRCCDMYQFTLSKYERCTLHEDFDRFFQNRQFCDVEFWLVGEDEDGAQKSEYRVQAHMAMVAARSTYLRERILEAKAVRAEYRELHPELYPELFPELYPEAKPDNPRSARERLDVYLTNVEPEAFTLLLSYIYTDRIDVSNQDSNRIVILMMDIYQLAVLFCIRSLENICLQYLEMKISKNNVLDALFNANKMRLDQIKEFCLGYIVKEENMPDIVMSDEFATLDKSLMIEIVRQRFLPARAQGRDERIEGTTLENDMAAFLKTGGAEFYDIELLVDDHVVRAHKSILAARCTYFQAMFRSFNPPDSRVKVVIGNISPSLKAFHSLLRYIYYGEKKMPVEDSLYLIDAPNFYGFTNTRLQAFCKYNLEHHINCNNVLQILEASDKMNVLDIKNYALRMIVHDFAQVVRLPQLKSLSRELLLELIQSMADTLSELSVSKSTVTYATLSLHDEL